MTTPSIRDVLKSLNSAFANSSSLEALPETTKGLINSYLETHDAFDNSDTQRLHDDLMSAHEKYVAKDEDKRGIFLEALSLLHPAIKGQARRILWWKSIVQPTLDSIGRTRLEIEYAGAFALKTLDYDTEEDKDGENAKQSGQLSRLLIAAYIARTSSAISEGGEYSLEDEHIASQLENVLIEYGRKRPKDLLMAIDALMNDPKKRIQALTLLSSFLHHQTPHLYLVSQTALVEHLLQCLMIDTSLTAIQLALTSLIMFLPHIPSSILKHLPRLFLIYTRLLCWDRLSITSDPDQEGKEDESGESASPVEAEADGGSDPAWEKLETPNNSDEGRELDLSYFFTFLYGLYPLNFTTFIRKPRRYLKNINFPRANELELDQEFIKADTEKFRKLHFLHPNFYNTTAEEELTDDRWLKSDPADVVAECIGLRLSSMKSLRGPGPPPNKKLPDIPSAYVRTEDIPSHNLVAGDDDSSTVADSAVSGPISDIKSVPSMDKLPNSGFFPATNSPQRAATGLSRASSKTFKANVSKQTDGSPRVRSQPGDSPTLPAKARLQFHSPLIPRVGSSSSFHSLGEKAATGTSSPAPRKEPEVNAQMLRQKLVLMTNELHFERYLKQQHLAHIGQLQRSKIHDATVSANTQNLLHINKSLKSKLAKSSEAYIILKKESATSRTQSKKIEVELSTRVRSLREAERAWKTEEENLRVELQKALRDCEALRQIVVDTESRELLSQQKVATTSLQLEELGTLRKRVAELETKIKQLESNELEAKRAADERDILRMDLATANLQMQSRDGERERSQRAFEKRIVELEAKLRDAENLNLDHGELPERAKRMVEAATNRLTSLKKEHAALRHAHAELELRYHELENEAVDTGESRGNKTLLQARHGLEDEPGYASSTNSGSAHGGIPLRSDINQSLVVRPPISDSSSALVSSSAPSTGTAKHRPLRPKARNSGSEFGRSSARATPELVGGGADSDTGSGFYSSNKSAFSMESLASGVSKESGVSKTSSKITYGRGGSQNSNKKNRSPDEESRPKKSSKGVGIRGFKGLI